MPFHLAEKIGERCTNSPHVEKFTCGNCYRDFDGSDGDIVDCECGATLKLEIEQVPICVTTIERMDEDGDD